MSGIPCPACKLEALEQRKPFEGGWLHACREYGELLHCSVCGQYYELHRPGEPVRSIHGRQLAHFRAAVKA